MKKSLLFLIGALFLIAGCTNGYPPIGGQDNTENEQLQKDISDLRVAITEGLGKILEQQSVINQKNKEIQNLEDQIQDLNAQIQDLEDQIQELRPTNVLSQEHLETYATSCNADSDCQVVSTSCSCSNVCRNIHYGGRSGVADCARYCEEDEWDRSITSCGCVNNVCV